MRQVCILLCLLLGVGAAFAQDVSSPATLPYSPSVVQDKVGNEWYVEQNGGLQRNGSAASMISSGMTMQFGNQQFYSQQPMISVDGKEIFLGGVQPFNGVAINRRIRFLDREGGLRYVEEFTNTTARDVLMNVEMKHSFNGQAKGYISDLGRACKDGLEAGESGLMAIPNPIESNGAPAVMFVVSSPSSKVQARVSARNNYQLSVIYSLTIPAGQTSVLVHAIAQLKVNPKATPEEIKKLFRPFQLQRLTRDLPRATLRQAVNISGGGESAASLAVWFPETYGGTAPDASDILVLDGTSNLKGHLACERLSIESAQGKWDIPLDRVAALAGPRRTQTGTGRVWLRDGQVWNGRLVAQGLKFTLINGGEMELSVEKLDRLVLAKDPGPDAKVLSRPLLETWDGTRLAFEPAGALNAETAWGRLSVPWSEVLFFNSPENTLLGGSLELRDRTRVRVLPAVEKVTLKTRDGGEQTFDLPQLRRAITPAALKVSDEADSPSEAFVELSGDQRLVGRVTNATLRLLTQSAPLDLVPSSIRELRDVTEELSKPEGGGRIFQAELWGGGTVVGPLENTLLRVEGRGYAWDVPARHLVRMVNPVPSMDSGLMRRIGLLVQQLGDAQWTAREKASRELAQMGLLAKGSLQEALKTATDPEITRRLEQLLQDMQ